MSKKSNRRWLRLVIQKDFQIWFWKHYVLNSILFFLFFVGALWAWLTFVSSEIIQNSKLLNESLSAVLKEHFTTTIIYTFILGLILVGLSTLQAYLFSRRLAGPLYAILKNLDSWEKSKDPQPFQVRSDDLFKDIVERLNRFAIQTKKR